jgi:hypothetical protein
LKLVHVVITNAKNNVKVEKTEKAHTGVNP